MKPLSPDTTVEAQRKHYELMRRLSPEQKLSLAFALTDATRQLILADLQHRFPQADAEATRYYLCPGRLLRQLVTRHVQIHSRHRKLKWFQAGNETSSTQWKDVLGVLASSSNSLDLNYLNTWSNKPGLTNLLQRAFTEVKED
ncbi:MAG TPA: hypothetical protein VGQ41_15600 [Pyrinomonadaceae bacterium]|jgi:hypothetical protein|nr:hypothetical protein [Pyrinomonadaceae bacterium]